MPGLEDATAHETAEVELFVQPGRKKAQPVADISLLTPARSR